MKYKDCVDCIWFKVNDRLCNDCSLTLELLPLYFEMVKESDL